MYTVKKELRNWIYKGIQNGSKEKYIDPFFCLTPTAYFLIFGLVSLVGK